MQGSHFIYFPVVQQFITLNDVIVYVLMWKDNANVRYGYTREGSSVFFTPKENTISGIENGARDNGLIGVKVVASPNTKWIIIAVTVVTATLIVGGCLAAAIILTRGDDDNGTLDPKLTTRTSTDNTDSTGTDTTTSAPSVTTSTESNITEPTVATWLPWNDWLSCSVTCGVGIHRRYRSCADGAFTCEGTSIETEVCTETTCPVYGKWTTWESWGSCSSSCGGGIQMRTRLCDTTEANALDCVGNVSRNRSCSNWNCPDCSQECTEGTLNQACDTCVCDNNIVTGRVVSNRTGNFLSNAFVYASTAPTTMLTQTNTTGFFTLETTCVSTELLIVKEGYVDTIATTGSDYFEVQMANLALPYFSQTPRPKYRLSGETVTLCCTAVATTGIDYYEWFKDSLLIATADSTDETMITLHDLLPTDSGNYQCRANSRYGAIMSPVARMDVKDNPDVFCENALQPKTISLPDGCVNPDTNSSVYEVGECVAHSCRFNESTNEGTCENETYSCCVMSEADIRTVQCTDYEVQLFVVRACGCAKCTKASVEISGTVVDIEDDSPAQFVEVWANGVFQTFTSASGSFKFEPSKSVDQISIYIVDTFLQQYLSTTKVFQISPDLTGTLYVDIKLFKASDPVELDSTASNTLVAGTSEQGSSIVQVEIPGNAFYNVDGTPYSGTVLASLTFLDPTNITQLDHIPGLFEFTDAEGQQGALDTYGVFNLYFRDSDGQPLALGAVIDLYAPSDVGTGNDGEEIKLWRLNTEAGNWDYVSSGSDQRRKRRQSQATLVGSIDQLITTDWWNYDRVFNEPNRCFYKVHLFEETNFESQISNPLPAVNVHTTYRLPGGGVRTIKDGLRNTEDRCISAICDDTNAYISAFDSRLNYKTYIYAAEPFLTTSDANLEFEITDDQRFLKAKMALPSGGPFFDNYTDCLRSTNDDSHLRWYYGILTDDWEVNAVFTPTGSFNEALMRASKMTWYPGREEGYRACYLKVRLEFLDSDILLGPNNTLKLRTTSFGESGGLVDGSVFGGRVVDIQTVDNQTICIEFKCSGRINPFFTTTTVIDKTRVRVEFDHPSATMECTMTGNPGLSTNADDDAQSGTIGSAYMFTAPIASGSDTGVYFATSDAYNLNDAKTNAKSTCHTGEGVSGDHDPLLGVGVMFTCRASCPNWEYWYQLYNYYYWYNYCNY